MGFAVIVRGVYVVSETWNPRAVQKHEHEAVPEFGFLVRILTHHSVFMLRDRCGGAHKFCAAGVETPLQYQGATVP